MSNLITQTEAAIAKVASAARSHLLALFTGGKAPEPHAITHLLAPLQRRYRRLQTETTDTKIEMVENASLISHFTPEVCAAAYKQICIEWQSEWHPTIAYIREVCAKIDYHSPAKQMQRAMGDLYPWGGERKPWPQEFGPEPGKPGCRLPQAVQDEQWRNAIYRLTSGLNLKAADRPLAIPLRAQRLWGIDVFADDCIIPRSVLERAGMTFTRAEWQADYGAYREKEEEARWGNIPRPLAKMKETPVAGSLGECAEQLV